MKLMLVSRAPLEKLQGYRKRMDWSLDWASTVGSEFNRELGFLHTEEEQRVHPLGRVRHRTYLTTARGLEPAMGYYGLLDRTPIGRNEEGEEVFWVRRHDEYEDAPSGAAT